MIAVEQANAMKQKREKREVYTPISRPGVEKIRGQLRRIAAEESE